LALLEIERVQIYALLGPNGAGKTTTVEILEGYRRRDGGMVPVLGVDPGHERSLLKPRIGIVLQFTGVERYLTVRETIAMYSRCFPSPRRVDEVIHLVGLISLAGERVLRLSGGQQRPAGHGGGPGSRSRVAQTQSGRMKLSVHPGQVHLPRVSRCSTLGLVRSPSYNLCWRQPASRQAIRPCVREGWSFLFVPVSNDFFHTEEHLLPCIAPSQRCVAG
jgi:hypothetical protein